MPRFPQPGEVLLGKYRVETLIGEGGMGAVLKAHHIDLDEPVAIKCLLPEMMDRKDIVGRFLREAKAAVKLKGEHIARVLDVGRLENQVPFIVMEYLDGADLNAIVKHHGAQEPSIAVDLMLQACEAMAEAHSIGIIHRDIKASNFFIIQPPGQGPSLKVLDFGIATAPEGTSDLTGTQSVIGTPAYMAPEQMRAAMKADARSDIWSMGVVLYELLEGERPFRSEVYSELVLKVGMDPPHPMENPAVSGALQAIVMKCLEKPMDRRYQTVAELAFDLMPLASDPVQARALVEQCARLLGRRSTKSFNAPRVDGDATPASVDSSGPIPVPRLTPKSAQMAVSIPDPSPTPHSSPNLPQHTSTVLGRPTPMPAKGPRTPTSVHSSNGQVLPTLKPSRRGLWIGLALLGIAAGGSAFYYTSYYDVAATAASAPVEAAPPPIEPAVEYTPTRVDPQAPPPPPPPPPEPTIAEETKQEPAEKVEPPKRSVTAKIKKPIKPTPKPKAKPATGSAAPKVEVGGDLYKKRQ